MISVSLGIKGRQREQAPLHPRNMPATKGPDNSIAHPQLDAPNPIYRRRTAVPKMYCPTHPSVINKQLLVRTHVKGSRSEEHTSELQSQSNLVCRLLLEKKKK